MLIHFTLQGVKREIRNDGKCFSVLDPRSTNGAVLAYCINLQNAILAHIKDASILDDNGKQEIIELKDYILRLETLFDNVRGASDVDIKQNLVFEDGGRTSMSEEHKAKIIASRKSTNKPKAEQPQKQEDEFDGL